MVATRSTVLSILLAGIFCASTVWAGDGVRVALQAGFGILNYEEGTKAFGTSIQSESSSRILLLEGLVELPTASDFYISGLFAAGGTRLDDETWFQDGALRQTNDIQVDLYNMELRLGYRIPVREGGGLHASVFLNAGYDMFSFERSNFVVLGEPRPLPNVMEEFDLLRVGAGMTGAVDLNRWFLNGEAGFGRYLDGRVTNSAFPGITLETGGNRWQVEIGAGRRLSGTVTLGLTARFSETDLEESEPVTGVVFPNSRTWISTLDLRLSKVF